MIIAKKQMKLTKINNQEAAKLGFCMYDLLLILILLVLRTSIIYPKGKQIEEYKNIYMYFFFMYTCTRFK